jgi:hypothetical protein
MGFGLESKEVTRKDMLESSIMSEPKTYAQRFRNRVFKHMLNHRDVLGFPKGCKGYPYFVCSNDLCAIANSFLEMVLRIDDSHDCKLEMIADMPNILKLLIKSYDEEKQCDHGCCGFWYSMDKEVFVNVRNQLKSALVAKGMPGQSIVSN